MGHAAFWYSAVSILLGGSALTIVIAAYARAKSSLAARCLFLQASLSFLAITGSMLAYIDANLPGRGGFLFELIDYLESPLAIYVVIFATIAFVHELFSVPGSGIRNTIAVTTVAFAYIAYNLIAYVVPFDADQRAFIDVIEDRPVYLFAMAYCLIVGFRGHARVADARTKRMALRFLAALALFLPAIALDAFDLSPIRPFPFLFFALSIVFMTFFIGEGIGTPGSGRGKHDSRALPYAEEYGLSAREREIVEMMLRGLSYGRIADALYISVNTVKTHIRNIYPKFGVNSRFELMRTVEDRKRAAIDGQETEKTS